MLFTRMQCCYIIPALISWMFMQVLWNPEFYISAVHKSSFFHRAILQHANQPLDRTAGRTNKMHDHFSITFERMKLLPCKNYSAGQRSFNEIIELNSNLSVFPTNNSSFLSFHLSFIDPCTEIFILRNYVWRKWEFIWNRRLQS